GGAETRVGPASLGLGRAPAAASVSASSLGAPAPDPVATRPVAPRPAEPPFPAWLLTGGDRTAFSPAAVAHAEVSGSAALPPDSRAQAPRLSPPAGDHFFAAVGGARAGDDVLSPERLLAFFRGNDPLR